MSSMHLKDSLFQTCLDKRLNLTEVKGLVNPEEMSSWQARYCPATKPKFFPVTCSWNYDVSNTGIINWISELKKCRLEVFKYLLCDIKDDAAERLLLADIKKLGSNDIRLLRSAVCFRITEPLFDKQSGASRAEDMKTRAKEHIDAQIAFLISRGMHAKASCCWLMALNTIMSGKGAGEVLFIGIIVGCQSGSFTGPNRPTKHPQHTSR